MAATIAATETKMLNADPKTTPALNPIMLGSPPQPSEDDRPESPFPSMATLLAGPTGMGTSASRVVDELFRAAASPPTLHPETPDSDPAYIERSWGDGKSPPLYVPVTGRINDALADEVDDRLVAWGKDCGFPDEDLVKLRKATFGRLVMLAHPDCDDPDRLLVAAKMNAAWWSADDCYADDTERGAIPTELPPRLMIAMAAMDPPPPAGEFSGPLDETLRSDPILVALKSAVDHTARYGTPAQVQRACYATFAMFVSWTAYAAWRHTNQYPPAWKYLAARQHDSFYTSMTLIDILGGYEVPANLYYAPDVRNAAFLAGTASVMVNDLFSVAKDAADDPPVCNMVLQIAADRGCSIQEATDITVSFHNDLVRDFQARHRRLQTVPSPELQRFLIGLRSWMGGGFEWHATNPRYKTGPKQ